MQAYASVFCDCGWVIAVKNDQGLAFCENPKCVKRGKLFRMEVKLIPIEERRV